MLMLLLLLLLFFHLPLLFYVLLWYSTGTPTNQKISVGPWKQAKLGQFSMYSTDTGQYVHQNWTYRTFWPVYCAFLSSNSLKKERLCLQIVLGQTRFEVYSASYYSPCDHSIVMQIGSVCWRWWALKSLATAFFYNLYSCHIVEFPIVKMVFEFFYESSSKYHES